MVFFPAGGNFLGHGTAFEDLVAVMARLRGPGGCPWDREQTIETLRTFLVEETYELLEAMESRDPRLMREELGDLLLEVVFVTQVCSEEGLFSMEDVVRGIHDKLVRRHPHVFGDRPAGSPREAIGRWEEIKRKERAAESATAPSALAGVPTHLPALMRAHRLSTKAGMVGFDWKEPQQLYDKLAEELAEFREAAATGDKRAMEGELGDLLFITANVGRHAGIDPELALQAANRKFISRFHYVEEGLRRQGIASDQATIEQLDALWEEAKALERAGGLPDQSTSSR